MSDLHDLSALEQGQAIRSGELTAVELAEHYLARGQRLGDEVGAYVVMTPELALEQARAADATVAGASEGEYLPPLLGVVCPVKDLNFVAGIPTRFGSYALNITPFADDNVVANLRAGGVVFTGKTNTPEMGLPCYTEPDVAPPARTPWDLRRSAAGSSGGAAAAVASGLAPMAHASDGGGSIRIPSSVTGIVGIKPSRGRISNGPLHDAVGDITTNGPVARTVADAAALLDVMAGASSGDPYTALPPKHGSFLDAARRDPGKLKIGYYSNSPIRAANVDPDVQIAIENTMAALVDLGHELVEITPPFGDYLVPSFVTLWTSLSLLTPIMPQDEDKLRPLSRYLRDLGRQVTGNELAAAISTIRVTSRGAMIGSSWVDAVLCPTIAQLPALVGQLRNDDDPASDFAAQIQYSPFCAPYNVTGQPAINVPMNWTADGLPIGIQLVGHMADEETIISLAAQLEQAHSWLARRPEIW